MKTALLLVALAATAFAQGSTQSYRVKQDDTLDLIAAEYYGDRAFARLIVTENKLKRERVQAGQRLRIPVTKEITTDKGDTFESLAETYLGDARRAVVLADFNERDVSDIPPVGTPLSIPIQITYVAEGNESFAQLAAKYWGDSKQGEMLRRYNFADKSGLEKGDSAIVPMIKVHVRRSQSLDSEARARRDEQRATAAEARGVLPIARTAWLQGDFARLRATLEPLAARVDYLATPDAIEVGMLLGKAQLAFDDSKRAVESFTRVIDRKPSMTLDAYAESPKVLAAWKQAGGQLAP